MMNTPIWGRYTELHPAELEALIAARPVVYLPWGALEWHGPHLPFGVDGLCAEYVAEQVAQTAGGVVLPVTWWPITALPHQHSLSIPTDVVRGLLDAILAELARAGFRACVLLTGHYAQGHELVLMDAADHALATHGLATLAIPPLALLDEEKLDHAGRWETAQMLALHPELVRLSALGAGHIETPVHAVLGEDPRTATAAEGQHVLHEARDALADWVPRLLAPDAPNALRALYVRRRAGYAEYTEKFYRTSWEQAIQDWWQTKNT